MRTVLTASFMCLIFSLALLSFWSADWRFRSPLETVGVPVELRLASFPQTYDLIVCNDIDDLVEIVKRTTHYEFLHNSLDNFSGYRRHKAQYQDSKSPCKYGRFNYINPIPFHVFSGRGYRTSHSFVCRLSIVTIIAAEKEHYEEKFALHCINGQLT